MKTITRWREKRLRKTADWLLSWVYDATDGKIYTGQNHIHIMDQIPDWMEKGMENKIICGWYVQDYGGVTTRIATDTVESDLANKYHDLAEEAQKAAMKYWNDNDLGEDYGTQEEYCPECDTYYDPDYEDHSDPYCPECGEHVWDLEEHNRDYHFEPEPWMPKEDSTVTYEGKQYEVYEVQHDGVWLVPLMPGGMLPQQIYKSRIFVDWDDWNKDQSKQKGMWQEPPIPGQTTLENPYPGWIEPKIINGVSTTPPSYWKTPHGSVKHCVDLQDVRVFAKLSYDYMGQYDDVDWDMPPKQPDTLQDSSQQQEGDAISQNPNSLPNEIDFIPPAQDDPSADVSLPDNPKMLDIAIDWNSAEYRWSYDGTQLHMWRVFNRSAYGPSHYDMFGSEGYNSHSQGRVYVSEGGKVGMLYWQITHPECERVLNEWCLKTFGKLPDYTYRAYGPYQGRPVSRWDFPIVEVGSLPLRQNERWWEQPGGYPGMKLTQPDYPSKKKKKQRSWGQPIPGPVDDQGQPITPGKSKRRRRTRNRKYRNRSFRGR